MVGVFDPKMEPGKTRNFIRTAVSVGAVAIAIVGLGAISANILTANSSAPPPTETAEFTTAQDDSVVNDSLSTEAPLILTSFRELEENGPTISRTGTLDRGDTLTDLMDRLDVDRSEANSALYALYDEEYIDPRRVQPGLEITAHLEAAPSTDAPDAMQLAGLTLKHESQASLVVTRSDDGSFSAHELHSRLEPRMRRISGTVETSLYEAALQAGAHDAQVYSFAQIFAYDVDFQREMRVGDQFEIVFEEMVDERGRYVQSGDVVFASLNGYATDRGFYRFTPSDDGITDYYDQNGESARKFLMKTPINGARLSSNFGYRRHPISGYNRLHKGTDFAAPTGTPIMAAGNGVVERASTYGGYGNYVRVRHANGYQTAYAHMSRYGPGIRSGARVQQGDIVGYVGSTGASTGPHLHYEVIHNGNHMNAMDLQLPTGRVLEGEQLEEFEKIRVEIDLLRGIEETETLFATSTEIATEEPETTLN